MHLSVENALEEIDAAFFSGDSLNSGKDLATVKEYVERWNRKILENSEYNKTHVPCTFSSVWDDGTEITADAIYDPTTGRIEAETSDSEPGSDCLEQEYIQLPDGTEIEVCTTCHEYTMETGSTGLPSRCKNPDCESRNS